MRSIFLSAAALAIAALCSACGRDEMNLSSHIDYAVSIEVRAPEETLSGPCDREFETRFCADEYVIIGVLEINAREERTVSISDDSDRCTNVLWLRLVRLDEVGPVDDPGTLIQLPTDVELELGAGAIHSVAFPQATVRIDEVGDVDLHQSHAPKTCAELGRDPRVSD